MKSGYLDARSLPRVAWRRSKKIGRRINRSVRIAWKDLAVRQRLERNYPRSSWLFLQVLDRLTLVTIRALIRLTGWTWRNVEVLFVHVPKAAGTSIRKALQAEGMVSFTNARQVLRYLLRNKSAGPRLVSFDHMLVDSYVEIGLISSQDLRRAFSFAVIREPSERLQSAFRYHRKAGRIVPSDMSFDHYVSEVVKFDWLPRYRNVFGLSHCAPFAGMIRPKLWDGPTRVYPIHLLEELERDLSKRAGLDVQFGHFNSTEEYPSLEVEQTTRTRIDKHFELDYSIWNCVAT